MRCLCSLVQLSIISKELSDLPFCPCEIWGGKASFATPPIDEKTYIELQIVALILIRINIYFQSTFKNRFLQSDEQQQAA